jgi:metal-sulfur cluster biosynthetic enzyme
LLKKDIMSSLFSRISALWKKDSSPVSPPPTAVPPQPTPVVTPNVDVAPPSMTESFDLSQPLSEELIYHALRKCRDPEIPVNIVDLGLIYDVRIADEVVNVKMTLTTQGCGMGGYISQEAEEQIRSLPGVREAKVEIVWDPPWDPSMISANGRKTLGLPE